MSNFNIDALRFQIASEVRVNQDGQAVFSIRAVGRITGVSEQILSRHFHSDNISTSKLAQTLMQYGFEGDNISIFGKTGVPDTAVAIITAYYATMAGERCTETAKRMNLAFAAIGVRAFAYQVTGYEKPNVDDYKAALLAVLEEQLPAKPLPYQPRYKKRFWEGLERVTGLKQGHIGCASFIHNYIYSYFPKEVQERLDEVNPLNDQGHRSRKLHQHFDQVLLALLIQRIEAVTTLLEAAETKEQFRKLVKKLPRIKFNVNNLKVLRGQV